MGVCAPSPTHADLSAPAALAAADEQRTASRVEVVLRERERLLNAQTAARAPRSSRGPASREGHRPRGASPRRSLRLWADRRDSASPCYTVGARHGSPASSPASDAGRRNREPRARSWVFLP